MINKFTSSSIMQKIVAAGVSEPDVIARLQQSLEQDEIRIKNLIHSRAQLLAALEGYMGAVAMMNAAMQDGGNVQGALSALVGAEDMAQAVIAATKGAV